MATILERRFDTLFRVKCDRFEREFVLTMPGIFNVENALAAIAAAYSLRIPGGIFTWACEKPGPAEGWRFSQIRTGKDCHS